MKPKRLTVFWGNERVSHTAMMSEQRQATLERMQGESRVLLVQDTTSFNFSHHPATTGMGPLENKNCQGFLAHSTLAVSTERVPLGVLSQQVWVRSEPAAGKSGQRHRMAFADKESYKWVKGLPEQAWMRDLPPAVVVCDAEAHIYEFLDAVVSQGLEFIVRAADAHSFTPEGQALFEVVAQQPVQAHDLIELARQPDREARQAAVELRFGTVTLRRPQAAACPRASLRVSVVDVREVNAPAGQTPVHWLLLTSLPVTTVAQAQQVVRWYTCRWLVERFHYVLKSGCKLEDRQLRDQARLARLLAVYNRVAWKLLWLTYQARQTPEAACTVALQPVEWQALYAFTHRRHRLPGTPPTLRQAVRWIAQLGGFLGRKGDGEPGVKVLWRGWTRLQDIVETWLILHPPPKDMGNA